MDWRSSHHKILSHRHFRRSQLTWLGCAPRCCKWQFIRVSSSVFMGIHRHCHLLVQLTLESSHCRRTIDITVRGQHLFDYVVFEELQRPSWGRIISVHNCGGEEKTNREILKSQVCLCSKNINTTALNEFPIFLLTNMATIRSGFCIIIIHDNEWSQGAPFQNRSHTCQENSFIDRPAQVRILYLMLIDFGKQ